MRVTRSTTALSIVALVVCSTIYAFEHAFLSSGAGLIDTVRDASNTSRVISTRRATTAGCAVDPGTRDRQTPVRLEQRGIWHVTDTGLVDLFLSGDAHVTWRVDGHLAHEHAAGDAATSTRTVRLTRGFHAIAIDCDLADAGAHADIRWAPEGGALRAIAGRSLRPALPEHPRLHTFIAASHRWLESLGVIAVAFALVVLVSVGAGRVVTWLNGTPGSNTASQRVIGRRLAIACAGAIVAYGALVRLDALTGRYGVVTSPQWLQTVQESLGPLRNLQPATVAWQREETYPHADGPDTHYRSDPYTYTQFARQMRHFYSAHMREPVFPFVIRIWLRLLDNQDVAVSFASWTFSVLAIWATYLLGSIAFSRGLGLAAALGLAIEYNVVWWDVSGWRDNASALGVLAFACSVLTTARKPTRANAALTGACAAFALLVRVTSLAFLLPGFLWLLFRANTPWKRRLQHVGVSLLVMVALAGPYLINCWRVYGDPLYAINGLAPYLPTNPGETASPPSAVHFVAARASAHPFETIDAIVQGLTTLPFTNKWDGYEPWWRGSGLWLSRAALIGLAVLATSSAGRLLLLLLVTSLVPFAFTWRLVHEWRYTEHAYPFFLIAAALCARSLFRLARPGAIDAVRETWPSRRSTLAWTSGAAVAGLAAAALAWGLPVLIAAESLRIDHVETVASGPRDRAFFRDGWSDPVTTGNVTMRMSTTQRSVVRLPLVPSTGHLATLRLDPFPRPLGPGPLPLLRVSMNGTFLRVIDLQWDEARVGSYDVPIPREVVRQELNEFVLELDPRRLSAGPNTSLVQPGLSDGASFGLW